MELVSGENVLLHQPLQPSSNPPPRKGTVTTTLHFPKQQIKLSLIPPANLQAKDYFSGSFFISTSNFHKLNVRHFVKLESASLEASRNRQTSKMLVDWTELSVEHFSHWWKTMRVFDDNLLLHRVLEIFLQYIQVTAPQQLTIFQQYQQEHEYDPLQHTIAVIAFQPYKNPAAQANENTMALTIHSLAATIASMYVAGFGRVLVVGYNPEDEIPVRQAFALIESSISRTYTTLGYTRITDDTWIRNYRNKKLFNMQRGVVEGLQRALRGHLPVNECQRWLGDGNMTKDYFNSVFLTEPDLMFNTKPWILPLLETGLKSGWNFFPHRLQPLPHQADFPSFSSPKKLFLLPKYGALPFSNITILDYFQDSCCDEQSNEYPGRDKKFGWRQHQFPCNNWWWTCGYHDTNITTTAYENVTAMQEAHKRLLLYPMMQLQGGSGVVFGSTEQGRRCMPSTTRCE